jgi:hypothetical protein
MKKTNCWEYQTCGRQSVNDDIFEAVGTCPASTERCLDGVNDGKNAGRSCWGVAGTLSGDQVQGDYASKIDTCLKCEFYELVRREEGDRFVTGNAVVPGTNIEITGRGPQPPSRAPVRPKHPAEERKTDAVNPGSKTGG